MRKKKKVFDTEMVHDSCRIHTTEGDCVESYLENEADKTDTPWWSGLVYNLAAGWLALAVVISLYSNLF
jgi:hypothetical protein